MILFQTEKSLKFKELERQLDGAVKTAIELGTAFPRGRKTFSKSRTFGVGAVVALHARGAAGPRGGAASRPVH
jgi:hypothetical protein